MRPTRFATLLTLGPVILLAFGCQTRNHQLERVAKDWCLTIRASQVLPVYPLTEDLQPGDVFAVQTPLSKQAHIYKTKGFLALDQHVTRLRDLPYDEFYQGGYLAGTYAGAPHHRPGWVSSNETPTIAEMPRAAFPTYNFSVQKGGGLKLAIPIEGVPVGLGLMGAQRATGSVTLTDTYTYGIDIEPTVRALLKWWGANEDVRNTMAAVAAESSEPVFLRVVNRVYLAGGVVVHLTNLDSVGAGGDAGVAPEVKPPDLSETDASNLEASARAYREALDALASGLNPLQGNAVGGSVRFAQASQRSVTMEQQFDRPLVIGYLGFDVKVFEDGSLSPPIPSYAVLTKQVTYRPTAKLDWAEDNGLSDRYVEWLRESGNRARMVEWLKTQGSSDDPADLVNSAKHRALLEQAAQRFGF